MGAADMLRIANLDVVALATPGADAVSAALAFCGLTGSTSDGVALSVMVLGAVTCCYTIGVFRLAHRRGVTARDLRRIAAFLGGSAIVLAAMGPPLAAYGEQLFSMHMIQHMMLIIAAAPLIAWSRPKVMFLRALPKETRANIGRSARRLRLDRFMHPLRDPILVWIAFCAGFVFWHTPGPYALAMRYESLGLLEHITFLLTSLAFWMVIFRSSMRGGPGYGAKLLFVLTAAALTDLPGALMVFAPRPLYPEHAAGVAGWGLTLMQDQEIAGLVMWIPGGLAYLLVAAWLFVAWLREAENRAMLPGARSIATVTLLLLVAPALTGCNRSRAEPIANFNGDPERGATLIQKYGCGGCHDIPNINDAEGNVGPPLSRIGNRIYIAGMLRNTPDNMLLWIREPQRIVPGNAMPQMNIPEQDARDIVAYLYTLN